MNKELGRVADGAGLLQDDPAGASIPSAVKFLEAAAGYFENRSTGGEDRAHWANVYNAKNCRDIAALLPTLERLGLARAIQVVRETRDGFLSEEYATGQPVSSFNERFACDQAASAIENEFGLGTMEQCKLLGKETPFEVYAASESAGLQGDAQTSPPKDL